MKKQTEILDRDKHYSSLTESCVSKQAFKRMKNFWDVFKCKNYVDYGMFYCHQVYIDDFKLFSCTKVKLLKIQKIS